MSDPYFIGISGASGMALARRSVQLLTELGHEVIVTPSSHVQPVWHQELDSDFVVTLREWRERHGVRYFAPQDFTAAIASGSYPISGMMVIPCSMGTLAAIATGQSQNLLQRAADCAIKEGRRLVLVPRETPLSAIHLENMLKLARLGVRIVVPVPAFYLPLRDIDDLVDQIVGRALVALGVPEALDRRHMWTGPALPEVDLE